MQTATVIPTGYRLKRIGRPERGDRILGPKDEVFLCRGSLDVVCAILEPVGGKGYEAGRNLRRRESDVAPQDAELTPEG